MLVLTAAIFWGVSGTVAQYLFQKEHFTVEWLTVTRLLISGVILLFISMFKGRILDIWKDKKDAMQIILFGIFGMIGVQFTFFSAIRAGNAATAAILQYTAPAMITFYVAKRENRFPSLQELFAVLLTFLGIFLLATSGDIHHLAISKTALFWGLLSAVALAFYSLQPIQLLKKWGATLVVGWGMLIGGVILGFVYPPWVFHGNWSLVSLFATMFVFLFGTVAAFYFYLESLHYLRASEASVLSSAEPLSATILAVVWLGVPYGVFEWLGTLFILSTIVILAKEK